MSVSISSVRDQSPDSTSAEVQESIAIATRAIPSTWPIDTFIAVNPLSGWEDRPFAQAIVQARALWHSQGYLPIDAYHAAYRAGRIDADDLAAAIATLMSEHSLPTTFIMGDKPIATATILERWLLAEQSALERDQSPAGSIMTLADRCVAAGGPPLVERLNAQMTTWCAAFCDDGQATWIMPHRDGGFWSCWRSLAPHDGFLALQGIRGAAKRMAALPDDPATAVALLLRRMGVPPATWTDYLTRHLTQLPGWASAIRWREAHPEQYPRAPITITAYLAVRLFYEAELVAAFARVQDSGETWPASAAQRAPTPQHRPPARNAVVEQTIDLPTGSQRTLSGSIISHLHTVLKTVDRASAWQTAYEHHYRMALVRQLHRPLPSRAGVPAAQAIFCIDVRSEGLRRHLEAAGDYVTFGAAGFFGFPITFRAFDAAAATTLCPALVSPQYAVNEIAATQPARRRQERNQLWQALRSLVHALRENLLTPFAFVEAVGWALLAPLLAQTLLPRTTERLTQWLNAATTPTPATRLALTTGDSQLAGMSLATQAQLAAGFLRAIGLTHDFAPLVLICGHGSVTANNPYAASLDCGACGGQHGGANARVAAAILNDPRVRDHLNAAGIAIPAATYFLAGEHTTTTDVVTIYPDSDLPARHHAHVSRLAAALAQAGAQNAAERCEALPGAPQGERHAQRHVATRAADWAQNIPEWGLARNAAFVCGRRDLTTGLNLGNRVFLHSYEPESDPTGAILEGILMAPLIVAEWINLQYYFSTVDQRAFGSGSKLLHSVVSGIGVMSGRHSDLRLGLPAQSVYDNGQIVHEPMRLLAIIDAPVQRIDAIMQRQPTLTQIVANGWITLVARDPAAGAFSQAKVPGWSPLT